MGKPDISVFCADNVARIEELARKFADYEPRHVTKADIINWLGQFQAQHWAIALNLAEYIRYYSIAQINSLMPPLLKLLESQLDATQASIGDVIFSPLGTIGESGLDIARRFRNANDMSSRQQQFADSNYLVEKVFKVNNPVVAFIDDFVGTGKQVCDAWTEVICQLVPEYIPMYLLVIGAFHDGVTRIEAETPLKVLSVTSFGKREQLQGGGNGALNGQDRKTIESYCNKAGNKPLGFGKLGALVSFAYDSPNNTISVIRGSEHQMPWRGLLPRWEDLR